MSLPHHLSIAKSVHLVARRSSTAVNHPLIGVIDQGTSSSRFVIFSTKDGSVISKHQLPVQRQHPQSGWVEMSADEIYQSTLKCLNSVAFDLQSRHISTKRIGAIGLTNQRETTVAWDSKTGDPLCPAIVWSDSRTVDITNNYIKRAPGHDKHAFQVTGLPLSSYFSAIKIRWLLDNVPAVRMAVEKGRLRVGTVDSWLAYKLSGGRCHSTDVTNASRTLLFNLKELCWDDEMCRFFEIPKSILPETVMSSSEVYSSIQDRGCQLRGTPLAGILGDQQAALVGQTWPSRHFQNTPANVKVTFGTGAFLLWNIGTRQPTTAPWLLTTIAYQMGKRATPRYAIEGSMAYSGATMDWLQHNLGLFTSYREAEFLAQSSLVLRSKNSNNHDACYVVPAFSGLLCPHWREEARAVIVTTGAGVNVTRGDVIAAGYRSSAYQTQDVIEAAVEEGQQSPPVCISVDGGLTNSRVLLQSLADITGATIRRPENSQFMTALGAAVASALAIGINPTEGLLNLRMRSGDAEVCESMTEFKPTVMDQVRRTWIAGWKDAVQRSIGPR